MLRIPRLQLGASEENPDTHACHPPPSPVSTVGFILSVWTMTDEWRGCSIPSLVSTAKDIHKTANVVLILISYFYNIT